MMFIGEKFCSHCGAKAAPVETSAASAELCPRCRAGMNAVVVGGANLRECPNCEGTWVDPETLRQICADQEKQAAVLAVNPAAASGAPLAFDTHIHYLPCPVCRELMNRVNYAGCSNVIVEVCKAHGTWFDRDQLRQLVEFIRAGGMEKVRARQIAELEEQRRLLEEEQWRQQKPPRGDLPSFPSIL
jgi:Zn-finger nucleic acid-binding protein